MKRILRCAARLAVAAAAMVPGAPVLAQSGRPDSGCARDVSRFCRAQMEEGDMVILACLKQHRAKLSKACAKALSDNGQ